MRSNGRKPDDLRPLSLETRVAQHAEGSCLVKAGNTHVLCTATLENSVPPFLKGTGKGWVTAEYGMLPRSTHERMRREAAQGRQGGRTLEIQRLIGRSLRSVCDLSGFGERQIIIDCDVLQADGGTRTAAITGGFVALHQCFTMMARDGLISRVPLLENVAAVSCGIVKGQTMLDLDYNEDSAAETDANFVLTGAGGIVEIQGTAEKEPFTQDQFLALLGLAGRGISALIAAQKRALDLTS